MKVCVKSVNEKGVCKEELIKFYDSHIWSQLVHN